MLISTLGLFEKIDDQKEFYLTGLIPDGKSTPDEMIRSIKAQCAWDLKIARDVKTISLPKVEELALLRLFDPQNFFLTEST